MTAPVRPLTGDILVPRDRDLDLAWQRGADGIDLYFDAFGTDTGGKTFTETTCRFDSAKGNATLPREVLAEFGAASSVGIYTANHRLERIGAFETELMVATTVFFPDNRVVALKFE